MTRQGPGATDILTEWFVEHRQRGGDFCEEALRVAGDVARSAERSGLSLSQAFEAGRTAYFDHVRLGRSVKIAGAEKTRRNAEHRAARSGSARTEAYPRAL